MKRFGTSSNSSHGKGKKHHSTRSHHSGGGRTLSVSSLPTINEEGRKKRVPSIRENRNKNQCICKKDPTKEASDQSQSKANCPVCMQSRSDKLARESKLREATEEHKGHVVEAGIADEEDSSVDSAD